MPTTNARKQTIPTGAEQSVSRATIFSALGNSIRDVVSVANTTARGQLVNDLVAVGQGPASDKPLVVHRADAPGLHRLEYTVDGSVWLPASGVLTFASKAAADSFATSYPGLLTAGDECRVGTVVYRWSGTVWYLPVAGGYVSAGTNASGVVQVAHGMGKAPLAVTPVMSSGSPVIPARLKAQVGTITATTFDVLVLRNDNADAPLASNPVAFYWTAVA
ncbi:hypothetical protein MicroSTF_14535 [Microbacterium sp. STF-2]|uniref:hypothetical protein n=1 Tax=Microbacterium sp. STF-2 TaxID=3031132 RepID=UPI002AFF2042|nr:hypothetical protein [Microbacterium sp. STF-2]MEA1264257.1 hypothetical protein [Microbacterium sp. STF-2]